MNIRFLRFSFGVFFWAVTLSITAQDYGTEVKNLLPEGKIAFEVLDSIEATARQVELTEKFQRAYQENMKSFNVYFEKTKNKQKAKYPRNKILSKKEWIELWNFVSNIKVLPSQTEIVEVIYSADNSISFKSDGKLEILNLITYHAETNTFNIDNHYTLNFESSVNAETNTNALQEAWEGYNWEFSEFENFDFDEEQSFEILTETFMENPNEISFKQYKITLGKLINSGKTFMIIKMGDFQKGNWIYNIEIPIRMK